jgi:hypothetical protein
VSVSDALPYGEAVAKAIWNYFGISDYIKILIESHFGEGRESYSNVEDLWSDAINMSKNDAGQIKLRKGKVVELVDFNFTEWFPWLPGMYWTEYGESLRTVAQEVRLGNVLNVQNQTDSHDPQPLIHPTPSTLTVMSGVGGVRMKTIEGDNPINLIGATTLSKTFRAPIFNKPNVSGAVPIVMSQNAYEKIQDRIKNRGVIKATIQGRYVDIPNLLDGKWLRMALNVPRFCIYVESKLNINEIKDGDDVMTAGWSIFEDDKKDYLMACRNFAVTDVKDGPEDAGYFINDYIQRYNGTAITDFDETPRLPALFSISEIKKGDLDLRKLQSLQMQIEQKYRVSLLKQP